MLAQAITAWTTLDLAARRATWDESFGHIVTNKENGIAERQNLVAHVKQFAAAFKEDPSTERVESLLRYMKRFINSLYERVEVAEDGFLNLYEKISVIDDPAPILSEAQQQLTAKVRMISLFESELNEAQTALEGAKAREQQLRDDISALGTANDASRKDDSEARQLVREYERQLATLEQEISGVRRDRDLYKRSVEALQERLDDASAAVASAIEANEADFASPVGHSSSGADANGGGGGGGGGGGPRRNDDGYERGRLADERVDRLQRLLDNAERDLQRALEDCSATEKRLSDAQSAHAAAAKDWELQLQKVRVAATEQLQEVHSHQQLEGESTAPRRASSSNAGTSSATYTKRITELERGLQRSQEELAAVRKQLRERNAAELDELASAMLSQASTATAATATAAVAPPHPQRSAPGPSTSSLATGDGYLTEADFSSLIGGSPATAKEPTTVPASVAAGSDDKTVGALLKQREALKKQLSDAHAIVARLNAQQRAPRFPEPTSAHMRSSSSALCPNCSGQQRGGAIDGGFSLAIGNAKAVAASAGANAGADKRRRDAALSALDRVGAMLGAMLQVSRAARVGVVLYLAALHLVVFMVVSTWSSAAHHHRAAGIAPRPSLRNLGVTAAPPPA